jgi:flagellar biosynthesis/type III secretory pathway M-ring protein FliF/YscJ
MDNQKFGISQFAEQVNYQRAIEGELARTIEAIGSVETARIHIAIPKQSVFVRDQQQPTASVMLNLFRGRTLDQGQVAGIVHLVSSAVPNLPVKNVTVVDQDGNMLSKLSDKDTAGMDQTQLGYVRQVEDGYVKRIESILEPIFGQGNIHAQVTANVDFSEVEQTSESYRPNSTPIRPPPAASKSWNGWVAARPMPVGCPARCPISRRRLHPPPLPCRRVPRLARPPCPVRPWGNPVRWNVTSPPITRWTRPFSTPRCRKAW